MEAELLPAARQTFWGRLAVANFFLGGTGAGAYVLGAAVSTFRPSPILAVVSLLGTALVLAGFVCVAVEAGRPLRGPFVLRKARSSWMSRELLAGGVFVACAVADLLRPWTGFRLLAWAAALLLVVGQGFILRRARGVAAWNVPLMPLLFLASGLAAGAGLLGIASAELGEPAILRLRWVTPTLVVLSAGAWIGYLVWPGDAAFRVATAPLRLASALTWVVGVGHLLPLLLTVGLLFPGFATGFLVLSGAGILVGALRAKAALVLQAGQLRPITLSDLAPPPSLSG